ncbi:MAG: MFS transporter, partial [Candidatus Omnitrophica bacterium]|nr:MFS transporter [Candidatus Omnitrophota bacterium]
MLIKLKSNFFDRVSFSPHTSMLDFITLAVQPFVKIRKEEWPKALLMFFYFFITITSLYILKPVRSSIFLEKSGFENLPYVWITTVLILMVIVTVYVKFASWLQKNVLLMGTVMFFISNILVFWWLLGNKDIPGLPAAFYIWVSIFSIMNVTQFWTLANDIFNPREAKRLFGFIGSGGILGGMCGGYITGLLVHLVGTVNLLIVAAVVLCFAVVAIQIIWKQEHVHHETKLHHDDELEDHLSQDEKRKQDKDIFRNIWRSKYLLLLLTMVCLAKLVSTLVEYQFNGVVQGVFSGIDKKTAFFGWFWGMLNTVSFVIMFFLTSRVLKHLGVKIALLILPIGLLFGNMAILLNPGLWSAVFTMMYDGSMNYSLNQVSKEVLYLPISREIRYRVKPFIDMVGYRTAKGIGSLLILFMTHVLIFNLKGFCAFTIAVIIVWIMAALVIKKEYLAELKSILIRERKEIPEISIQSSNVHFADMLIDAFSSGDQKNKFYAVRALNLAHDFRLSALMTHFNQAEIHSAREEIRALFHDPHDGVHHEIKQILHRHGLDDFEEWIQFVSGFRGGQDIASIRVFLASQNANVQKAAFLLLVLLDQHFDYQKLPE